MWMIAVMFSKTIDSACLAEVQQQLNLDLEGDTGFEEFKAAAQRGNVVPMHERIFSDHLTPVLAYRCLVRKDDRSAPSFLFEAVNNGTQQVLVCALPACHRNIIKQMQ